jgi:hypothetical protein
MIDLNNQNWVEGFVKESYDLGLSVDETTQLLAYAVHNEMYKSSEAYREGFEKEAQKLRTAREIAMQRFGGLPGATPKKVPDFVPGLENKYRQRIADEYAKNVAKGVPPIINRGGTSAPSTKLPPASAPTSTRPLPAGNAANVPPLKGRTTPAATPQGRRQIPLKGPVPAPSKPTPKEAPKKETAKKKQKVKETTPSAADAAAATAAGKKEPKDLKMKKKPDAASDAAAETAAAGKSQGDVWKSRLRNAALLTGGGLAVEGVRRGYEDMEDYQRRQYMDDDAYMRWKLIQEAKNPEEMFRQGLEQQRAKDLSELARLKGLYDKDSGGGNSNADAYFGMGAY